MWQRGTFVSKNRRWPPPTEASDFLPLRTATPAGHRPTSDQPTHESGMPMPLRVAPVVSPGGAVRVHAGSSLSPRARGRHRSPGFPRDPGLRRCRTCSAPQEPCPHAPATASRYPGAAANPAGTPSCRKPCAAQGGPSADRMGAERALRHHPAPGIRASYQCGASVGERQSGTQLATTPSRDSGHAVGGP